MRREYFCLLFSFFALTKFSWANSGSCSIELLLTNNSYASIEITRAGSSKEINRFTTARQALDFVESAIKENQCTTKNEKKIFCGARPYWGASGPFGWFEMTLGVHKFWGFTRYPFGTQHNGDAGWRDVQNQAWRADNLGLCKYNI